MKRAFRMRANDDGSDFISCACLPICPPPAFVLRMCEERSAHACVWPLHRRVHTRDHKRPQMSAYASANESKRNSHRVTDPKLPASVLAALEIRLQCFLSARLEPPPGHEPHLCEAGPRWGSLRKGSIVAGQRAGHAGTGRSSRVDRVVGPATRDSRNRGRRKVQSTAPRRRARAIGTSAHRGVRGRLGSG
jgi:hypothetical protein